MIRNSFWGLLTLALTLSLGCGRSKVDGARRAAPSAIVSGSPAPSTPSATAATAEGESPAPVSSAPRTPGTLEPIEIGPFLARLAELGGKGTLVNAFASWCGPCRQEVPMLEAIAPNLARDGIRVVFVSFDEPEDRNKAESFLRANDVRSPAFLALDGLTFRTRLAPKWPGMIPATFLLDETRKLRYFWGGPAFENDILPIVEGFLAGRAIDGQSNFALSPGSTE